MDSDALLIGEHQNRTDFPPSFAARAVADAGGYPWVTLTCRDRNRVVLRAELEALVASRVAGPEDDSAAIMAEVAARLRAST